MRSTLLAWLAAHVLVSGCGTVDLGANIVSPEVALDESFFFCRVQPEVVTPMRCAGGQGSDAGGCHAARSALRLRADPEMAGFVAPTCDAQGRLVGAVPDAYRANFEASRLAVQSDALSSPFYRRPTSLDSHPRRIFATDSPEARLIIDWIARGAR